MEYFFTDEQILAKDKKVDYFLLKNEIKTKNLNHSAESGFQQTINYIQIL